MPQDPGKFGSDFRDELMRSVLTEPLRSQIVENPDQSFDVIITLNEFYRGGLDEARDLVLKWIKSRDPKAGTVSGYVFASLTGRQIADLVAEQRQLLLAEGKSAPWIYRIWEDSEVSHCLSRSLPTVKADAAHRSFGAYGSGIVWAVLDSGIDGSHVHFAQKTHSVYGPMNTLTVPKPVEHDDFTPGSPEPLVDQLGHGTHVAGIIAGAWESPDGREQQVGATEMRSDADDATVKIRIGLTGISGVAPRCRLVSMKVIADRTDKATGRTAGKGKVSWILRAIERIQQINENGRKLRIHGANLSLGYGFDPRWFACGQSPLCVEVNRLVKSGVCVVVAAGNDGHGSWMDETGRVRTGYHDLSINDPGNADLAMTVGATHRDMPHTYGVSYFSSRGPTGDGRLKPDLVAPGERIVSCAAGSEKDKFTSALANDGTQAPVLYCEQSGTSMAAPHVSGAIAAFLSVRGEFVGQPEKVKQIFLSNTIDLGRERYFQGYGLLDLMKVLQAI